MIAPAGAIFDGLLAMNDVAAARRLDHLIWTHRGGRWPRSCGRAAREQLLYRVADLRGADRGVPRAGRGRLVLQPLAARSAARLRARQHRTGRRHSRRSARRSPISPQPPTCRCIDHAFDAVDRALGLDWTALLGWMNAQPALFAHAAPDLSEPHAADDHRGAVPRLYRPAGGAARLHARLHALRRSRPSRSRRCCRRPAPGRTTG